MGDVGAVLTGVLRQRDQSYLGAAKATGLLEGNWRQLLHQAVSVGLRGHYRLWARFTCSSWIKRLGLG